MPSTTRTTRSTRGSAASQQAPLVRLGDDGKAAVVDGDSGGEDEGEDEDDEEDASEAEEGEDGDEEEDDEDGDDDDRDDDDEDDDEDEGEDEEEAESGDVDVSDHDSTSQLALNNEDNMLDPNPTHRASQITTPSSSSTHLDPSLFQTYFSSARLPRSILKTPSTSTTDLTASEEQEASRARKRLRREIRLKAERKGGIVRGRDGQPMKRLKDGRTIVRALNSNDNTEQQQDDTDRLARKRSEGYRRKKLGLQGGAGEGKTKTTTSANIDVDADDPLGLNDPAFMPGGEFAHLASLTGKKRRRSRSAGGASKADSKNAHRSQQFALPKRSAQGARPAFGFRRGGGGV